MPGIFNFPYLQVTDILNISEQDYPLNQSNRYQKNDTNLLVYVKRGQLLIRNQRDFILNPHELLILPTDEPLTLTATVPHTTALQLIFQATSKHLTALYRRTFTFNDEPLLTAIHSESQTILDLRRRKPEMSYDMEIGEYFIATSALLYSRATALLVKLCQMEIKNRLPQAIRLKKAEPQTAPDPAAVQTQLHYAHATSGALYKQLLVNQIIAYMKLNLEKPLTIEKIAQEFLLGSSNLKRIFKAETSTSIMAYFRTLKMARAKELITEHHLNFTKIAAKLGFNSVHHFSAAFKNYTGMTPSQYYQRVRPQEEPREQP
ncbi:helix-turn-helix transcriptional regulator [Lactiplantibacillus modestisalitolerans]|uniref:Helix-turn-helix transcriptional regulator n=1 Tax=Lactiplantibacillus modestisalitolerans TaxID=1457219 RepID=A0ABV5WU41_9LACO|nr:helix-turn-helix transcriptional regulator [Lactiplantibacillus modestisalitolerans]